MKTKEIYQQGLRTYLILKNCSAETVFALSLRTGLEVADHQRGLFGDPEVFIYLLISLVGKCGKEIPKKPKLVGK